MNTLSNEQVLEISQYISAEDLPGDLAEAAEFIGVYKALLLAVNVHGTIYIKEWDSNPETWTKHVRLIVETIGIDDTSIIVGNFKHTHFIIPKCDAFWRAWTHKIIVESTDMDNIELSRLFNYSERHIFRIKSKLSSSKNQMNLFSS